MRAKVDSCERSPKPPEEAARAAVELRADRAFTDSEWAAARARLLDFADILRSWEKRTSLSERGNV
jgi:hypothetical protein